MLGYAFDYFGYNELHTTAIYFVTITEVFF